MVNGGMALVKYLLFLFNLVFWLSGIGMIVLGTVIQLKYRQYINIFGDELLSAPIIIIITGVVCLSLSFFGCCGAIRENYCMTMTFAVLLALVLMLEMGAGITSYILHDDVEQVLERHMISGMARYNVTDAHGVTVAWDRMQQEFHCCGVHNYTDWRNSTLLIDRNDVPDSCCKPTSMSVDCGVGVRDQVWSKANLTIHVQGCVDQLKHWIVLHAALVGGTVSALAGLQILGICFACCLSKSILKDFEDYYY